MKKTVSLARALKEKNRLGGELRRVLNEIITENVHLRGTTRHVDVHAFYERSKRLRQLIIQIKTVIALANRPIVSKIIELAEVKSEISFMGSFESGRQLRPSRRSSSYESIDIEDIDDYMDQLTEETVENDGEKKIYTVFLNKKKVWETVTELQKRANALQDELDEFNATTKVEIELE
jgi:hypothetical protein